jgi:ribitol-5-phosphate 2-dehydrogenase (NADP+) / D-ribitol-5-phosphate cytidylyltransferase
MPGPLAAARPATACADHLRGRAVVIFGGSSGIGRELRRLAQGLGADVFSFSRSTTGTYADNPAHVRAALDQVQRATGRIDAIVVAAGLCHRRGERLGHRGGDLFEAEERSDNTDLIDDTDLTDHWGSPVAVLSNQIPVTVAHVGLPYLLLTKGQLLLFTSGGRDQGDRAYAPCSSATEAIITLTEALAGEWAPSGVRVNCINPELLSSADVALTSLDVLASDLTGQMVEVRPAGPASVIAAPRPANEPTSTCSRRGPGA